MLTKKKSDSVEIESSWSTNLILEKFSISSLVLRKATILSLKSLEGCESNKT